VSERSQRCKEEVSEKTREEQCIQSSRNAVQKIPGEKCNPERGEEAETCSSEKRKEKTKGKSKKRK